jgi:hypothetical protein
MSSKGAHPSGASLVPWGATCYRAFQSLLFMDAIVRGEVRAPT